MPHYDLSSCAQRVILGESTSLASMVLDVALAITLADLDAALVMWQAFAVRIMISVDVFHDSLFIIAAFCT